MNFQRTEYHVIVVNNTFQKDPAYNDTDPDFWVWSFQNATTIHMPERWGYIQFSTGTPNTSNISVDPNWGVRSALMEIYNNELAYLATGTGIYTNNLTNLNLHFLEVEKECVPNAPKITVTYLDYEATIVIDDLQGHVRPDRLLWFTEAPSNPWIEVPDWVYGGSGGFVIGLTLMLIILCVWKAISVRYDTITVAPTEKSPLLK